MNWEKKFISELIVGPITGEWGTEPSKTEPSVKVIRTTNFTNDGTLKFEQGIALRTISKDKINKKALLKGDIIIEKSGGSPNQPVGRVVYFDEDGMFLTNNFTSVLRPRSAVWPKYLFYQLFNLHRFGTTLKFQNKTTGIINLKLKRYIEETEIPLPPLPVQRRIAAILDVADEHRRKTEALIEQYDELAQSIFLEMFGDPVRNEKGWEVISFGEAGKLDRGKSKHRPRNAPELLGGVYPLIQTGDIANSGGYITKYNSTYSDLGLAQSKMWPKGTLCITIAANIAKTGILNFDACFPDSVVGFIPNEKTCNEFVQYWMSFLQKIIEEKAPFSAQKNINLKILRDLEFFCPPYSLQIQFADTIKLIQTQKSKVHQTLLHSETLFQSLLQRAFRGELVPEDEMVE